MVNSKSLRLIKVNVKVHKEDTLKPSYILDFLLPSCLQYQSSTIFFMDEIFHPMQRKIVKTDMNLSTIFNTIFDFQTF